MDKAAERRKAFKAPRTALEDTQQLRRAKALEEQKRKRLQRVDSLRQLDLFADLNIGPDDDEDDEEEPVILREGISQFASLLPPGPTSDKATSSRATSPASSVISAEPEASNANIQPTPRAKRKKRKGKRKPSKWANKCMYAELLEMNTDPIWSSTWTHEALSVSDGLPDDLETAWVALAPVPAGKRCLAVTMQSAGVSGVVPNTILRSRLLGKVLLPAFPSPFPPNTILDCILDENWKKNGILHVLDVIRWKSQDVAGCDASFRFWWRDTRLKELPSWPAPPAVRSGKSTSNGASSREYRFPYPRMFVPVPYSVPTTAETLLTDIIPRARIGITVRTSVPIYPTQDQEPGAEGEESGMQIDFNFHGAAPASAHAREVDVQIRSDGILLYVAEAMYESGTSPLAVWVPASPVAMTDHYAEERERQHVEEGGEESGVSGLVTTGQMENPLDVFERLVRRRLALKQAGLSIGPSGLGDDATTGMEL